MALMTLVAITAVQELGVASHSFVAVIGAAGLAIGLALQGSLANFAAGVMIIGFRPFKAGDYIEAGGTAGTVQEVQIFSTFLKTPDNKLVIVPNGSITSDTITNYSATGTRRLDLVFGIGYGDDMKKAKQIIEETLGQDERVLEDPKPVIAVAELGDSSVNIVARPWVKTGDYWDLRFHLTETIKRRFDEEGISIPFPQRDVHLFQAA
jgi:small conductance mechanosensitive channel